MTIHFKQPNALDLFMQQRRAAEASQKPDMHPEATTDCKD